MERPLVHGSAGRHETCYTHADICYEIPGTCGEITHITIAQHMIIAYVFNRKAVNAGIVNNVNKVVNHLDACRWNNSLSNLEWITQEQNVLHGAVVKLIHKYFPNNTIPLRNLSGNEIITLREGISYFDIERYNSEIANYNHKITNKASAFDIRAFLQWLVLNGIWKDCDFYA